LQEGVNIYSVDGQIIETNPSAIEILGLSREQQLGRDFVDPRWQILSLDGHALSPDQYPVARAIGTGGVVREMPVGVVLPSGERRWITCNATPVRNPASNVIEHVVVTFKDVTQQRLAEDQLAARNTSLAEALAVAEKASRAKSDFISVMSHELRTPMNAVLGCAQLLARSAIDPSDMRTLNVLTDAGRQMLAVLNDLLDLGSLDADKMRPVPEPVSLVRLVEDAALIWAADIQAKGLELSVMIDPGLVAPRLVDPARLLQIVGNVMANAVKFTSVGGISIAAWPVVRPDGRECIEVQIDDTGPGVPDEAAARIFSAFEQVDVSNRRKQGGLGIGLSIARKLARAMGGTVNLEKHIGEGSRFLVQVEAPLAKLVSADAPPRQQDGGDAQREVLCVDDNARNLFVLSAILRAAGHSVTECSSGQTALSLLAERKFDVVLLDMVMPEIDGLEVLRRLRAEAGPNSQTSVIACTANVLPEQINTYLKAGTAGVLAKPIEIAAVLRAVAA
jgi:PAS domain S-box-containing protein